MGVVTYVSSDTAKTYFLRSMSGDPIAIPTSKGVVTVYGDWRQYSLDNELVSIIAKMRKFIQVSQTNPNKEIQVKKTIIQGLKASKTEIKLIEGSTEDITVESVPKGIEFPTQLIPISDHLGCASAIVNNNKVTITAHKVGSATIKLSTGNVFAEVKILVFKEPKFIKQYYEGLCGEYIDLTVDGQSEFELTLPEGIRQEGNKVISDNPGDYEVLCTILGKTISTKVKFKENPKLNKEIKTED